MLINFKLAFSQKIQNFSFYILWNQISKQGCADLGLGFRKIQILKFTEKKVSDLSPSPRKKSWTRLKPEMPLPRHHAQLSTCLSPNSSFEVQNISASIVISYQWNNLTALYFQFFDENYHGLNMAVNGCYM